jgi:hypothetical protein
VTTTAGKNSLVFRARGVRASSFSLSATKNIDAPEANKIIFEDLIPLSPPLLSTRAGTGQRTVSQSILVLRKVREVG